MADITGYVLKTDARSIWDYFVNGIGFSKEGTAALMGNLYAESGLRTDTLERLCIQRYKERGITWTDGTYTAAVDSGSISRQEFISPMGRHYGYGLAQWTVEGRKAGLYDLAKSRGTSIASLGVQLDYLYSELEKKFPKVYFAVSGAKDIREASDCVLYDFEAPANASQYSALRADYGAQIYRLFGGMGMAFTDNEVVICGHGSGTPSKKNMASYCATRYSQTSPNGVRRGLVAVRRLKALKDADRARFHDLYRDIIGRNIYSQDLREYCYTPYKGRYYSDCSSSIILTYKQIGHKFPWTLNTAAIYQSDLFETVPVRIVNGHVTNPEVLKVGDCLLFAGNDPSRPLQIGHVEAVYELPSGSFEEFEVSTGTAGMVSTTQLTVRSGPGTEYQSIGSIQSGTPVYPTKKAFASNGVRWYYSPALLGWVSGKYLTGWVKEQSGRWWYAIPEDRWYASSVQVINGSAYAFGEDGYMVADSDIVFHADSDGSLTLKG